MLISWFLLVSPNMVIPPVFYDIICRLVLSIRTKSFFDVLGSRFRSKSSCGHRGILCVLRDLRSEGLGRKMRPKRKRVILCGAIQGHTARSALAVPSTRFCWSAYLAYCLYYKPSETQMCDKSVNFSTLSQGVLKLGICKRMQIENIFGGPGWTRTNVG